MDFLHDKKGVIVAVDGGICSQIHMCAIGLKFAKMGYNVKYDLSFFEDTSMDSNSSIESATTLDFKATLKSNASLNSNTTLYSNTTLDSNTNTDSNISIESNTIAVDTGGGGSI